MSDMPDRSDTPVTPNRSLASEYTGRRLTWQRRLLHFFATPLALGLVKFWWATCRIVRVEGGEHVAAALKDGPMIAVFWHQHLLFGTRFLLSLRNPAPRLVFAISPSVDGEIPAMLAKRMGVGVMRGSSSHTGARSLRDFYLAIREGWSPALNPDGPYGPRYVFKPGAILLAQLSGRPVVPIAFHAEHAWQFRAWDRFVLPRPFSRIVIGVGEPRYVPRGIGEAELVGLQSEMAAELRRVYRAARAAIDHS
jgi:lysophospholipid acyltransferase (LPLAT)-like uncharacterized protein